LQALFAPTYPPETKCNKQKRQENNLPFFAAVKFYG